MASIRNAAKKATLERFLKLIHFFFLSSVLELVEPTSAGVAMELPMALKMKNELLSLLELKTVGAITEAEFLENKSVLFRTPAQCITVYFRGW